MKGHKKTITFAIIVILFLSILSLSISISFSNGFLPETTKITIDDIYEKQAITTYYREWMNLWVGSDGWFHSEVAIEGVGVTIGNLDFWELPSIYSENLDWVNLDTWSTNNPNDNNAHLNVRFTNISLAEATSAADFLVTVVEQFMIVDFHYDGFDSYDGWRGKWVEIIDIQYSGHVDWTGVVQTYSNAIPTENGGIAERVDVEEANGLRFEAWYDYGWNDFIGRIGVTYNPPLETLSGSHSLSLKEKFHVTDFEASPVADGPLGIHVNLPDVSSLVISPWYNDSLLNMEMRYHPNIEEPWNKNDYNDIIINLEYGKTVADFVVEFDYAFKRHDMMIQDIAEFQIDARGYIDRRISYQGEYAQLSASAFDETLLENAVRLRLSYSPLANSVAGHSNTYLEIMFQDTSDYTDEAYEISIYVESILCDTYFYSNWSWTDRYWDKENQVNIESSSYGYYIDNIPEVTFSSIISNSLAYNYSAMIATSNILSDYTRVDWEIQRNMKFDYFSYWLGIRDNALDYYIETPTKDYAESTSPSDFTIDILDEFGWSSLPFAATTEQLDFDLIFPITSGTEPSISPDKPNGWGYNYWYNVHPRNTFSYIRLSFDYYTDTPYTTDYQGTKIDPVTNWSVTFNHQFLEDSVDLAYPSIHDLSYDAGGWWDYDIYSTSFSSNTVFGVHVNDYGYQWYWDTSSNQEEPRFIGSGIDTVNGTLYYESLPTELSGVSTPVSFTYDSTNDIYTSEIDFSTDDYADGDWIFEIEATDFAGNVGYRHETISVDKYDASYNSEATASFTSNTPSEGSTVEGPITIEAEISDDVGVFLVVLWVNFGGWILDDLDEDGIYLKEIETQYYLDGPLEIIIEVWDMEGHYTVIERSLTIDNIISGDEPSISIISPSNSETVSGTFLFQADVNDDVGLRSVSLEVDGRTPIIMSYNEGTGYYEYDYNTNQLTDGEYMFQITAIDEDENTHVVSKFVTVTVTGSTGTGIGISPDYTLVNVPINQSQAELATQIVEADDESKAVIGDFLWEIEIMDDIAILQVVLSIDTDVYIMSGSDSGPNIWSTWTYDWDSTEVADGAHLAFITISDIDENQHEIKLVIGFTTSNGNVREKPTIGLDGFEFFWAIIAIVPISIVLNNIKRRKLR